jgi:hypothetical protein
MVLTDIDLGGDLAPDAEAMARGRGGDDGDDLVDGELARRLGVAGSAVDNVAGAGVRQRDREADEAWCQLR